MLLELGLLSPQMRERTGGNCRAASSGGTIALHTQFFPQQKEKMEAKEKRKNFKAETIKRLPQKTKCYCFSHSGASRIQKFLFSVNHDGRQYFSVSHAPSTLKSISPSLNCPIIFKSWKQIPFVSCLLELESQKLNQRHLVN